MFKFLREFLFGIEKQAIPTKKEVVDKHFNKAYPTKSTYVEPISRPRAESYPERIARSSESSTSIEDDIFSAAIGAALIFETLSDSDTSNSSDSSVESSGEGFDGGFGGGDFSGGGSQGSWDDSSSSSNDSYSSNDSSDSYSSSGGGDW